MYIHSYNAPYMALTLKLSGVFSIFQFSFIQERIKILLTLNFLNTGGRSCLWFMCRNVAQNKEYTEGNKVIYFIYFTKYHFVTFNMKKYKHDFRHVYYLSIL